MLDNQLEEFIQSKDNRRWLHYDNLSVYVRKALHMGPHSGEMPGSARYETLDVATVDVDEGYRGQGLFTQFLEHAEELADKYNRKVFVESIQEPRLVEFLKKRGYSLINVPLAPHMMRLKFS